MWDIALKVRYQQESVQGKNSPTHDIRVQAAYRKCIDCPYSQR